MEDVGIVRSGCKGLVGIRIGRVLRILQVGCHGVPNGLNWMMDASVDQRDKAQLRRFDS